MRQMRHPAMEDVALEQVFHALSDPFRLGVIRRLADGGEQSCAALEGGRAKSSVSHHFRVLRDSGLILTRPEGTTHMNSLRAAEVEARFPGLLGAVLAAAGVPCDTPRRDE